MKALANYIDGEWMTPSGNATIPVVNPYTEEVIARVSESTQRDVDQAVAAARAALPAWSATTAERRASLLEQLSGVLMNRAGEFAEIVVRDLGSTLKTAENVHIGLPAAVLAQQREYLPLVEAEQTIANSLIVREPVGVVAAITPWNYPLHQLVAKVAPALLAGCTMVVKPSEVTPLIVKEFFELIDRAGFPRGSSTSSGAAVRLSARCSQGIPAWTSCPSPGRPPPGVASLSSQPPTSPRRRWSSGASPRASCCREPSWRERCARQSQVASSTPGNHATP